MEKLYSEQFPIPCYMFDCCERLRPSSFFDIAQELAAKGSAQIGATDQDLLPHSLVWILARMTVCFDSLPRRLDTVTAQTWHRGLVGSSFIRDYALLDALGRPCVRSTSSWIIMDTRKRTIARPDSLAGIVDSNPQNTAYAIEQPCAKIVLPASAALVKSDERKVLYSDLDYNGHVNNARYIVWALDCLPLDTVKTRPVRQISVNFNREARPGDIVELNTLQAADTCYVEGRDAAGRMFVVQIIF